MEYLARDLIQLCCEKFLPACFAGGSVICPFVLSFLEGDCVLCVLLQDGLLSVGVLFYGSALTVILIVISGAFDLPGSLTRLSYPACSLRRGFQGLISLDIESA